jgi:hypothetical protein
MKLTLPVAATFLHGQPIHSDTTDSAAARPMELPVASRTGKQRLMCRLQCWKQCERGRGRCTFFTPQRFMTSEIHHSAAHAPRRTAMSVSGEALGMCTLRKGPVFLGSKRALISMGPPVVAITELPTSRCPTSGTRRGRQHHGQAASGLVIGDAGVAEREQSSTAMCVVMRFTIELSPMTKDHPKYLLT